MTAMWNSKKDSMFWPEVCWDAWSSIDKCSPELNHNQTLAKLPQWEFVTVIQCSNLQYYMYFHQSLECVFQ